MVDLRRAGARVLAAPLLAFLVPANGTLAQDLFGAWTGEVEQVGSEPYTIEMQIDAQAVGTICGDVLYPELDCGGALVCLDEGATNPSFREVIVFGRKQCIDGGTVTLRPGRAGTLQWQWFDPLGIELARATLARR